MASYGALLRKIPTSEINRLLREKSYSRWAYFIDENSYKVGVVFANDNELGAYVVEDVPDPKLNVYGLEAISDLKSVPDPKMLVVSAGTHQLRAAVFNDLATVDEDEFLPTFSYDAAKEWQQFLASRQVMVTEDPRVRRFAKLILKIIVAAIVGLIIWKILGLRQ